MQPCQLVERQMRFLIGQRETDDDVLTADLGLRGYRVTVTVHKTL